MTALAALLAASSAAAQPTPLEFLRRLVRPPVAPPTDTFRQPESRPAPLPEIPLPRLRPAPQAGPDPAAVANERSASPPRPLLVRPAAAATSTCGHALAMLGVTAIPMASIQEGACGIGAPVAVSRFSGGAIALTETAVLDCPTAEALAIWLDDHVRPAARSVLAGEVTGLRIAASYACRARNSQADAKLSEHARGNAVDLSALEVSGHGWIEVGGASGERQRFLAAVRRSACGPFTTVLGPGSDAFHEDHFHLDAAVRGRDGRSLYCR